MREGALRMACAVCAVVAVAWFPGPAPAQMVAVANASFEEGADSPAGWRPTGAQCYVAGEGAEGARAIGVRGSGTDDARWESEPPAFEPHALYALRFRVRTLGATGNTLTSGPGFCNRDLGLPGAAGWQQMTSYFVAPGAVTPEVAPLHFGQWRVTGQAEFDAVELMRAVAVDRQLGRFRLGAGERVKGNRYTFDAPFAALESNYSRPLQDFTAAYNTNRWYLGMGREVVYQHVCGDRRQRQATVMVNVCHHTGGALVVEVAHDGATWRQIGRATGLGTTTMGVPAELFPARDVWVRLRAEGAPADAALSVDRYVYESEFDGQGADGEGRTQLVRVPVADPRVEVRLEDFGEALPGRTNTLLAPVRNLSGESLRLEPALAVRSADGAERVLNRVSDTLGRGERAVHLDYTLGGTGDMTMVFTLGGDSAYRAESDVHLPVLFAEGYGEQLPGSSQDLGLWWASSGWKVARTRPVPARAGTALRMAAAANEGEAAQLVLTPAKALEGVRLAAEAASGPSGAVIPAEAFEVLRVRYLDVSQPTDATGMAAPWPDPLPPLRGPVSLEGGMNHPFWLRLWVPKGTAAGQYRGAVRISWAGGEARVPVDVEVYGFELPDRLACQTALGFSPDLVFRYQGVSGEAQRREVLDRYWASFASHHISPYNPVPLDAFTVTWPDKARALKDEVKFDWTAWDREMARVYRQHGFTSFMAPTEGLGGGTFASRVEPELLGFGESTEEYRALFRGYYKEVESHLKKTGYLGDAFVYWFDEPDPKDYDFVSNGFRKLKEAAPGLTRMLTEQPEPALYGGPNLWCPITPEYSEARARERMAAGERFWWYVCTGPKAPYATLFLDHAATELRVWLWQTWQRGIEGILVWQTNWWTSDAAYPEGLQNPYADPMSWTSGYGVAKGVKQPWGNGDGRFLYPPEAAADGAPSGPVLEGPVDSIRWEMLRDGLEDYEYLALLRWLLEKGGRRLPEERRAQCEALLAVPEAITADMTHFTTDPAPIEAHRDAVARAIASFPEKLLRKAREDRGQP